MVGGFQNLSFSKELSEHLDLVLDACFSLDSFLKIFKELLFLCDHGILNLLAKFIANPVLKLVYVPSNKHLG